MCTTQVTQVMFLVTCLNGADCYDPRETQTTTLMILSPATFPLS